MDAAMRTPKIFISYAWQDQIEDIAKPGKFQHGFSDYPGGLKG
jgi:hypothetical protein